MANLIKSPGTTVVTQGNECVIKLEISLNINVNGQEQKTEVMPNITAPEEKDWFLPEFDSSNKIKFGKEKS